MPGILNIIPEEVSEKPGKKSSSDVIKDGIHHGQKPSSDGKITINTNKKENNVPETDLMDTEEFEQIWQKIEKDIEEGIEVKPPKELNEDDEEEEVVVREDPIFEKIKEQVEKQERSSSVASHASTTTEESDSKQIIISEHFHHIPYGIQPRAAYEHGNKNTDIMGVAYNSRMRLFVVLDSKGITTWKRDNVANRVKRPLTFPKYEYRLISNIIYVKKYNCYFALSKDFSLKVMNRDFDVTYTAKAGLRSVLFMIFNPVKDELITGGVGGTEIWTFDQISGRGFMELKPLANYELVWRKKLPNVGGSWVKKVELDLQLQHLYCCSETDLNVYDLNGKLLKKYERAHTMSITGCVFSTSAKVLITSSVDCEVKVWSLMGGMVHSFRGHSRAVTGLLIHPDSPSLVLTSSLDGSFRIWSLDTMEQVYNLVVSSDGVLWMGLTDDNVLYLATCRNISMWNLNQYFSFWALSRNNIRQLTLSGHEGKSTRLVSLGDDNSIRLYNRKSRKMLTTVLPIPALHSIYGMCYSREFNAVFVLVDNVTIWVYTTRTDPACRVAEWNVHEIQVLYVSGAKSEDGIKRSKGGVLGSNTGPVHRATENGLGNETVSKCMSLCILNSSAMVWTDEGYCCPIRHSYLLLGLEDGRILFMDPVIKGEKYMEFKASKDAILGMEHDMANTSLVTMCEVAGFKLFQMWSLPELKLMHEVYCKPDVQHFARLDYSFLTGHESGEAFFHYLLPVDDPAFLKVREDEETESHLHLDEKEVTGNSKRLEHNAPLVALDASSSLRIFCSASADGAIKIWDEFCVLLSEMMLEESLSAACFLNDYGDMIVGFQSQLYFIDHSRVCPQLKACDVDDTADDNESHIYENPDVLFEGGLVNEEEVTMDNYLVPYKLDFSDDFLEGRTIIDQSPKKEEESEHESESESDYSMAATDTYLSPPDSPSGLSDIDLTLGSGISKFDLLKQMSKTLRHFHGRMPRKKKKVSILGEDNSDEEDEEVEGHLQAAEPIAMPSFGASPGPSPMATPPPGGFSPVEVQIQHAQFEHEEKKKEPLTEFRPIEPAEELPQQVFVDKPIPAMEEKPEEEEELKKRDRKSKYNLDNVRIDVKGLMRPQSKRVPSGRLTSPSPARRESDHSHVAGSLSEEELKRLRELKKKQMLKDRKMPKGKGQGLTRQELIEMKRLEQERIKHKYDVPLGHRAQARPPEKKDDQQMNPLVMLDNNLDAEQFQDMMWDPQAPEEGSKSGGLMGMKLDLPPQRQSTMAMKPPRPLTRLPPPKKVEEPKPPGQTPGVGASPTLELELEDANKPPEKPIEVKVLDKQGKELKGLDHPIKIPVAEVERDAENTSPDVETSAKKKYQAANGSGSAADIKKLSDQRKAKQRLSISREKDASEKTESPLPEISEADIEKYMKALDYDQEEEEEVHKKKRREGGVLTLEEKKIYTTRPFSSVTHEEKPEGETPIQPRIRPQTAHVRFQAQLELVIEIPDDINDLQSAFDSAFEKYKSLPGTPSSKDKLYKNDGTAFEGNWQERAIERHLLLRMQRELRCKSAAQKRQEYEESLNEKRRYFYPGDYPREGAQTAFGLTSRSEPGGGAYSYLTNLGAETDRINSYVGPTPTPQPPHLPVRPHTAYATMQSTPVVDKNELKSEKPFRFKISTNTNQNNVRSRVQSSKTPRRPSEPGIDPKLVDPRNPHAVRPVTTKSIPSKCNRYMLVSRPKEKTPFPLPSPMEEQLLAERFPNLGMKVYKHHSDLAVRSKKVSYCIEYSPFCNIVR